MTIYLPDCHHSISLLFSLSCCVAAVCSIQSVHDLLGFLKGLLLCNVIIQYKNLITQCCCKLLSFLGYLINSDNSPACFGCLMGFNIFSQGTPFFSFFFMRKKKEKKKGKSEIKGKCQNKMMNKPRRRAYQSKTTSICNKIVEKVLL